MAPDAPTLSLAGIGRGIRTGLPLGGSGFVYGIAFGTLAAATGLSAFDSLLMSALVFSGTAQIAVLQVWHTHPGLLPAALLVLVANIRYVLMGASLRPWLGQLSTWRSTIALVFMVDGAYAIGTRAHSQGDNDAGGMLGASLASYIGWVIATGLGFMSSRLITDPKAIGLDFVIIAFCVAAAALMVRGQRDYWPAIAACAVIVAVDRWAPGPWTVVAAGLAAAAVAGLRYRAPQPASTDLSAL
jgi:predicted branched-subunit amino acid permease